LVINSTSSEGKREVGPTGEVASLSTKTNLKDLSTKFGDRATHSRADTLDARLKKSKIKYHITLFFVSA
jgi:hypothetical protein